jgi:hypothetical protein
MASALACRLCRVPISATVGCAVCDPFRRNLVVTGEDEDERPSLSGTASEVVTMLRGRLKNINGDLERNASSALAEKRGLAVANTLAKVLESARKLQADGRSAVEAMSFQERKELFVEWYTDLAPAYRNAVREAFAAYEVEVSKPRPEAAPEPVLS